MATPDSTRLAVLIDGDNTTPTIIEALLAEIAKYGSATVKRAYGDWTTPNLRGWKEAINAHAIQPMQQFAYTTGKNATDSALIIDAMDLLYTGNLDGFCLVSSDSDFTKLASRLRESGKTVYGFGEPKTPKSLVAACDKFVYLDVLRRAEKSESANDEVEGTDAVDGADDGRAPHAPKRRSPAELRGDAKLLRLMREGIDASSDDEGWAHLGGVGSYVNKQASDFDPRNWGYAKLVDLVKAIELFEIERAAGQGVRVRERPKGQPRDITKAGVASAAEKPAKAGATDKTRTQTSAKPTEKVPETAPEKPAKRTSKRATRGSGPA